MKIVVDASVLVAVVAEEPSKPSLLQATAGHELVAPGSIHWEIGNAFSTMLRRKRLTAADAVKAIEAYKQIPIEVLGVDITESVKLAARMNLYAYDAYILQCATKYGLPLISLDENLIRVAQAFGIGVVEVT
ncbi:MAG: type II toxin-antitoxin system VapC family toxin [Phycisphaerae bacterium]